MATPPHEASSTLFKLEPIRPKFSDAGFQAPPAPDPSADPELTDFRDIDGLRPLNWNLLTAAEAETEWRDLDVWVTWLRHTYGLPPAVLPPLWHRHDELVWELSALHQHWLAAYDVDGPASGPLAWHREFAEARIRLREWVSLSGTRLDRDRPTRVSAWPGEPAAPTAVETPITDRAADFEAFVREDIAERARRERGLRRA